MKASELVERLQKLINEYGDLPVNCYSNGAETVNFTFVDAYDENGNDPMELPAIEISLI